MCCPSNIYTNAPILNEGAVVISEKLQESTLDGFSASDGWSDGCKSAYVTKEHGIFSGAGDFSEEMIASWMERLEELTINRSVIVG